MKKTLAFLILVFFPILNKAEEKDLIKLRNLYYEASVSKDASEKFAKATQSSLTIDKITLAGYSGMAWMIKANHSFNPYNKLSFFFKGKDLLNGAIESDPKNVELRFLRYCVQTNAPGFLGYSGKISEDKTVLLINYAKLNDADLKSRIREYMKNSKDCTKEEKLIFK